MTETAHQLTEHVPPQRDRTVSTWRRSVSGPLAVFVLVFAAQLAFGVWMNARGFLWADAFFRSANALFVLNSGDPKLANIGFVWMPLPTLLNLPWAALFPFWPTVVSSGFASSATGAVCSGATAAVLLVTADRLNLPRRVGWAFALLVAANPMLFLYGSSGMSEAVAAPFLTGAVCFMTLFWYTGQRLWVAAAGIALALGFASVYQAVPLGAALFAALIGGVLWSSEARQSTPQGRGRAVEGLSLLLLVPALFVGILWIGFNAVIMSNPLFFVSGAYGYSSFASTGLDVAGDATGALTLVGERVWPFLIPLAAVLLVRLIDRRVWRVNTLSVVVLGLSVPLGMIVPMAYLGSPMGYLRYVLYPLLVAAGWGLYEIAISERRRRALGLIVMGWIVAAPALVWTMSNPKLGVDEHPELRSVVEGIDARQAGHHNVVAARGPIARYLNADVLPKGRAALFDAFKGGAIAVQIHPDYLHRLLVLTFDKRFEQALADPAKYNISYFLIPEPTGTPQDALVRLRPRLWEGKEPGFELQKSFPLPSPEGEWRLYGVRPGVRVLPAGRGVN
jgi:hypothetical protein